MYFAIQSNDLSLIFVEKCFINPCPSPDPLNPEPPVCANDGNTYDRCIFPFPSCQADGKLKEVSAGECPPSKLKL